MLPLPSLLSVTVKNAEKENAVKKKQLVTCSKCKTAACNLVQHYPCRDKCTSISESVLH